MARGQLVMGPACDSESETVATAVTKSARLQTGSSGAYITRRSSTVGPAWLFMHTYTFADAYVRTNEREKAR